MYFKRSLFGHIQIFVEDKFERKKWRSCLNMKWFSCLRETSERLTDVLFTRSFLFSDQTPCAYIGRSFWAYRWWIHTHIHIHGSRTNECVCARFNIDVIKSQLDLIQQASPYPQRLLSFSRSFFLSLSLSLASFFSPVRRCIFAFLWHILSFLVGCHRATYTLLGTRPSGGLIFVLRRRRRRRSPFSYSHD